jgi:HEAT repeat protein
VPLAKAVEILLELLRAEDFAVRSTAVMSLAARDAKERIQAIVAAARASKEMDVRIEAATALGVLGFADDWVTEAAAGDPEVAVRAAARDALKKLGFPSPSPLLPASDCTATTPRACAPPPTRCAGAASFSRRRAARS